MKCPKCDFDPEAIVEVKPVEPRVFYPEKSLADQVYMIETMGWGLENYEIKGGQYIRKRGK